MSLKQRNITMWPALALVLCLAGGVAADDRDFLRERAAPPNMLFIVDTSGSMVGSPETPGAGDGSIVAFGMVPGGGDDPYSRMGIAKAVLRDFLADVTDANYAFAGYAQAVPADGSNAIPQKHWVYEARTQDRFHLVEANFVYRFGLTYAQSLTGILLDNPGELFPERLIGYNPYFDPATSVVRDRFGPVNAFDTGALGDDGNRLPYDLMPLNFSNCVVDDKGTPDDDTDDVNVCKDRVFPLNASANRDAFGDMIPEEWYYGDAGSSTFPNCDAYITPIAGNPDDGCWTQWNDASGGVVVIQRMRRVQLNMPLTNPDGGDNHPRGVLDPDGVWNSGDETVTGNQVVTDPGGDDNYDLDATTQNVDYDGNETSDWILYVDLVEEQNSRECGPPDVYPTWTPTNTPTNTPTATNTPTPRPADCSMVDFINLKRKDDDEGEGTVVNSSDWAMKIVKTEFWWEPQGGKVVSFKGTGKEYLKKDITDAHFVRVEGDDGWNTAEAWYGPGITKGKWLVKVKDMIFADMTFAACLDFNLVGAGAAGGDLICTECDSVVLAPPKDTPVPKDTAPPADTPDPSWTATPTETPKDTKVVADTKTPTPIPPTATPVPTNTLTPTHTPKPTKTPKPPTATPMS